MWTSLYYQQEDEMHVEERPAVLAKPTLGQSILAASPKMQESCLSNPQLIVNTRVSPPNTNKNTQMSHRLEQ